MADPRIKKMKIQIGVCKRLTKEKAYYEKEVVREQERFDKFKADGKDEYELRKQNEVINESKIMIPDTKRKLSAARDELGNMLDAEKDLEQIEEYKEAKRVIDEADKALEETQEAVQ